MNTSYVHLPDYRRPMEYLGFNVKAIDLSIHRKKTFA
jgi:hypothetical protein